MGITIGKTAIHIDTLACFLSRPAFSPCSVIPDHGDHSHSMFVWLFIDWSRKFYEWDDVMLSHHVYAFLRFSRN